MAARWACIASLIKIALALHVPLHHVDLRADPARPGTLSKLLHELVPEWAERAGAFTCNELSGGLTNRVIRARPAAGSACESLLLRVFGENSERVLDRDKELRARQTLSDHHRFASAAVMGTFCNGRVERYAPGRVISLDEMRSPSMAGKIARQLARLHHMEVPDQPRQPSLWAMLDKWLTLIEEDGVAFPAGMDAPVVRKAIHQLRERIDAMPRAPVVTFAHNDVSALNLVFDERSDRVALIDFEYAMYNYRSFDLANHLAEYAGSGPIRWECLPTEHEQLTFLTEYVRASMSTLAEHADDESTATRALLEEVQAFYPASHLVWGLWGLHRSSDADACAEFDYRTYAEERLRQVVVPV